MAKKPLTIIGDDDETAEADTLDASLEPLVADDVDDDEDEREIGTAVGPV